MIVLIIILCDAPACQYNGTNNVPSPNGGVFTCCNASDRARRTPQLTRHRSSRMPWQQGRGGSAGPESKHSSSVLMMVLCECRYAACLCRTVRSDQIKSMAFLCSKVGALLAIQREGTEEISWSVCGMDSNKQRWIPKIKQRSHNQRNKLTVVKGMPCLLCDRDSHRVPSGPVTHD